MPPTDNPAVLILDPASAADGMSSWRDALGDISATLRVHADLAATVDALGAQAPPDLILIRARAGFDGVVACGTLRTQTGAAAIPMLLIDGFTMDEHIERALQAGANDVLRAPFTPALLQARVRSLLALASARAELRRSSALLTNLGHEIRASMPTILGMSHLALQGELDARQRQDVELAARSGELLLDTLNDILVSAGNGGKRSETRHAPFALTDVLDTVAKLIGPRADAKGLELLFEIPPDLPATLVGDAGRLRRALTDLATRLERAARHGELILSVQCTARDAAHVRLRFSVRDTSALLPGEPAPNAALGLGLEISEHLVGLLGSDLEIQPGLRRLATLAFSADFDVPQGAALPAEQPIANGARVLIVDDNLAARRVLETMCRALGLSAESLADGWDALRAVELAHRTGRPYAMVLLDAAMPAMDGPACARQMMRGEAKPSIVMMVGAHAQDEVLRRLATDKVAVRALLPKPVMPGALRKACANALPLKAPPAAPPAARTTPVPERSSALLRGARVLIVDDNPIILALAVELLRGAGMEVITAGHGAEALDRLATRAFDLVLMDCQMPVLDGFEATQAIRAQPQLARLPVIALTAGASDADRERVTQAGMNDFIAKPIDVDLMFATLARWIGPGAAQTTAAPPPGDPLAHLPGIDVRVGRASTMNNDTLYRRLLKMFREGQRDFAIQFRNARAAGDQSTATRLAHNLRAVSGSLGAVAVQHGALALEGACSVNANDAAINDLLAAVLVELDPVLAGLKTLPA